MNGRTIANFKYLFFFIYIMSQNINDMASAMESTDTLRYNDTGVNINSSDLFQLPNSAYFNDIDEFVFDVKSRESFKNFLRPLILEIINEEHDRTYVFTADDDDNYMRSDNVS